MKHISTHLAISLMIVFIISGYALGYYQSPEYQQSMFEKSAMDLGPADRWVDKRYLEAMIRHHQVALNLAQQVQNRTQRNELKQLSADIIANEPKLIQELYDFKKNWYQDDRQVTPPKYINLGEHDDNFDLRFLNALIYHHQDGIAMTQEIRTKSSNAQVLNNADAVENFLRTTLEALKGMRSDWYQVN